MLVQSFSGIRGIYGRDLTDNIARRYAYVFNEFLKHKLNREPLVVIGYDTRRSNKALKQAILEYLTNMVDVGVMPIAAIELAVREYNADGGIAITASHNPPEYGGFKFLDKDGAVLRPKDINRAINDFNKIKNTIKLKDNLKKIDKKNKLEKKRFIKKEIKQKDKKIINKNKETIEKYFLFLKKIIGNLNNKINVILDINGGSGVIVNELIKRWDLKNIKIINDKEGEFKRAIEPDGESLSYLKGMLEGEDAEFAAGFDCDADRVEILMKDGRLVDGNCLLALIMDSLLAEKKGTVVVNDATSNLIRRIAEKHKCEVKEVEVGEINVVDEMLRLKSPIGGEGSNGGVIIPPSRCRDGILSILYLLKIMNEKNKSLSDLINELPEYYNAQKKIRFDRPINIKLIKNKLKKYYLDKRFIIQETGDVTGGLKVIIDKNNFVWFRVSKTEANLLRIIADSNSKAECSRIMAEACSVF